MKRTFIAGIGAFALIIAVPFASQMPEFGVLWQSNSAIAQNIKNQPKLELRLEAEKQVLQKDNQGKQTVTWQALKGKASVQPGDVLRYTLVGENTSDRPIKNLTLNPPIPRGMVYVLKSTEVSNKDAKITYSIDGGRNFTESPTVQTSPPKPAPASAYTNIRLQLPLVAAKTKVKVTYLTQVR